MPRLMLMRHGKSHWDGSWTTDHERPLAPRGSKAAARMGRFLTTTGRQPSTVISSTAERAAVTARLAAEKGRWECSIVLDARLYSGGPEVVLDVVRALKPTVDRAMIVGHNPTWAEMTSWLIGGGSLRFPTAAIACLDFGGPWKDLQPGSADLLWFITPRLLEATS